MIYQLKYRELFFVLGWIAERCPDLIKEIHSRGHEIASHGFDHHLCYNQSLDELRYDLLKSKNLLESITKKRDIRISSSKFFYN